jgi:hypothetical protein
MRQTRHVACTGEMRNSYKIMVGNLKEIGHLVDLNADKRIILNYILKK